MNSARRICLSAGAVLSICVVLFIFGLIFYIFLTTPNSILPGNDWEDREGASLFRARIPDVSNLSIDASELSSHKRSARLVEWVNINPDSPWIATLNPSAIGMERQRIAGAVSEVLSKSSTMQTYLKQFYDLVEKEFHQLYSKHVDSLEKQQLRKVPTHFNAAWRWLLLLPVFYLKVLLKMMKGHCHTTSLFTPTQQRSNS